MTIGQLSRLFSDLHLDHRKTVAAKFGYDESVLVTWLKSLTILRNVCAHHGRLWNASITADAPKYAKAIAGEFPSHNDRGRIFARAVVVPGFARKNRPHLRLEGKVQAVDVDPAYGWLRESRPNHGRAWPGCRLGDPAILVLT
ncbi:TPA: Abi family protein [Pseudomonas aeruginosa]